MNKMIVVIGFMSIVFQGCSSAPSVRGYEKDETLSTLNGKDQPDWADESTPFVIRSGKVYSVGVTTLRGEDRPEAGFRIAENNARANFAKTIENRLEFVFQNSEENAGMDSTQARYIGSEVSSITSHSMRTEGHWYKRYAQSQDDGSRRIYYKVYSLVTMPEEDLKKAVNDAISGKVAEHKLSQNFQQKVDAQWDRFVEGKKSETKVASNAKEGE
jgi:hypothetical protein